jgi:mycofactocin system creatininase family protein
MRELAGSRHPGVPVASLVLVPVGSIEQHGPHLPLDTDTAIAIAVAERAADLLGDPTVLVAPPINYGASGEHQSFAGTTSIGSDILREVIVELTRSLRTWCGRVVFVNGHGGNFAAIRAAVAQLLAEGHQVAWVPCTTAPSDAHAGYTETSLMIFLRPWAVRQDLAEAGNTLPVGQLLRDLIEGGVAAVSPNGILGDPTGASALEGKYILERMAAEVAEAIRDGEPDAHGRLHIAERSR